MVKIVGLNDCYTPQNNCSIMQSLNFNPVRYKTDIKYTRIQIKFRIVKRLQDCMIVIPLKQSINHAITQF